MNFCVSPKSENRIKDSLLKLENATFSEEPNQLDLDNHYQDS